ncbi:transmembrane protein 145-like [Anopheles stephensi]|uniref:transmembrane protein 145-like n=1 Tax=Anopheles stephensi TaxID=30069 RepID=UPI0016587E92|nr:transmembrane protein 145-like [Anopheles stephensi]
MTLLRVGIVLLLTSGSVPIGQAKYVEGHLKTSDNWAFLARFCFLSGKGRYEYLIEYEKKLGELKLLLYYDDRTQWPAVYKTDKTCTEKLSVLHPEDNQIVPLSPRTPYNLYSGCHLRTPTAKESPDDPLPRNSGTTTTRAPPTPRGTSAVTGGDIKPPDDDAQYYDQFLKTSTTEPEFPFEETTTGNGTEESPYEMLLTSASSIQGGAFAGDNGEVNLLENSTDYRLLVEQLFPGVDEMGEHTQRYDPPTNGTRLRRAAPPTGKYETRLIVSCSNFGSFTSSRERWWYIAIANCDGVGKGLDVKYRFRMTNGPPGDFWHEHFSADEMYIPPILLAESIAYSMLLLAVFICAVELKARHLYHCTYRLFTLSVLLQWFGILLLSVTWTKYAVSGIGPFPNFGGIFTSASEISFLLLLLLMAKGYTITRARLKTCSTVKITIFINLYVVVYVSLYIYQAEAFDPGEVLNLYESPAGFGLAGLRCAGWVFFMYACAATIRKFTEKTPFYYPFTMLGSLWILSGPVLTLLGVSVLDPWVRESVMHGALGMVAFAGHLAFLWLTWPSRANRSFPYHVRTNHVGISHGEDDEVTYPKHPYEPTTLANHHNHPLQHQYPLAPSETVLQNGHGNGFLVPLARGDGLYDQYLRERDIYHSTSTPLSYVSFPAPAGRENGTSNGTNHRDPVRNGHSINSPAANGGPRPDGNPSSEAEQRNNRNSLALEVEADLSGHPSLEVAEQVSSNPPLSGNGSVASGPIERQSSGGGGVGEREEKRPFNPFLAGASSSNGGALTSAEGARKPNRIILPSLEHGQQAASPVMVGSDSATEQPAVSNEGGSGNAVPKHLFAAKRDP